MLAPSGELLRAGLALKLNHVKRAVQSYMHDRTNHATGTVTSYVVAAGLFAVAALFGVAAFFVGVIALYRWVALTYGQFWGFGAAGVLLLAVAATCAGMAAAQIRRKTKPIVPLASRLRVAIVSPRIPRGTVKQAVKEVATAIPLAPLGPDEEAVSQGQSRATRLVRRTRPVQLGLMVAAAGLLGVTMVRRRRAHSLDD